MYSNSFIHVWTTFEHQVQHFYASHKLQVFYSLRRLQTYFRFIEHSPLSFNTNYQLSFADSVLKDVANVPPKLCCQLSVLIGHCLFGDLDCRTVKDVFLTKNNAFFPSSIIQRFSQIHKFSSVTSHLKCTVFQAVFKTKSYFCLTVFLHLINVKKSEKLTTASFRSIWQ